MFAIGDKVFHIYSKQEGKVLGIVSRPSDELYEVLLDDGRTVYDVEDAFQKHGSPDYHIEVDYADNVIIVKLCDDEGNEVARGHGHIIHEGALGIAQAVSYAARKVLYALDDKQPEGQKVYARGVNKYGFNTVRQGYEAPEGPRFHHCFGSCK